jgi:hypothetical protein
LDRATGMKLAVAAGVIFFAVNLWLTFKKSR